MARKGDFNADEWSLVVEAPALAALRVITAERGGTLRESLSLGRAYAEARTSGGSELMEDLVGSAPQIDRGQVRTPEDMRAHADARLREALAVVDAKATPEEAQDYRRFVLAVADTVAHAHREGGFLGIGGKDVSEREQAVLDELAATVETPMGGGA